MGIRNVRNFWVRLHVDGRVNNVESGPRNKDGGFIISIHQRDDGAVNSNVLMITGDADEDGTLLLRVWDEGGEVVHTFRTKR